MNTLITSFFLRKAGSSHKPVLAPAYGHLTSLERMPTAVAYDTKILRFDLDPFTSIDPDGVLHPIAASGSLHVFINGQPISMLDWQMERCKHFTIRKLMFDPNTGAGRTIQIVHQELLR